MDNPKMFCICNKQTGKLEHFLCVPKGAKKMRPYCGAARGKQPLRMEHFNESLTCRECDVERQRWSDWWNSIERREANGGEA